MLLVHRSELASGCICLRLNQPKRRNPLSGELMHELIDSVRALDADESCRVILLTGEDSSFCAGLDLDESVALGAAGGAENQANAEQFASLLFAIHTSRKPTIALVNGAAFGAGAGLVAACDIAVTSDVAQFRFPEVRIGLIPAVISPYVVAAIGARMAVRYFLTAESFDPPTALRIGLVHEVVPERDLVACGLTFAEEVRAGGPQSLTACKQLVGNIMSRPITDTLAHRTASTMARQRMRVEAREGIAAALAKDDPPWRVDPLKGTRRG